MATDLQTTVENRNGTFEEPVAARYAAILHAPAAALPLGQLSVWDDIVDDSAFERFNPR